VHRYLYQYWLIVAASAGVVVGPRVDGLGVELIGHAQRPEPAQAATQVMMTAGGEHPTTVLTEPLDGVRVGGGEAVTDVDGHQPQLVDVELVDMTQY